MSESVELSNNHKLTLCAFKRRPIMLSICPDEFFRRRRSRENVQALRQCLDLSARDLLGSAQRIFRPLALRDLSTQLFIDPLQLSRPLFNFQFEFTARLAKQSLGAPPRRS